MKKGIGIISCIVVLFGACATRDASYHYVQKQLQYEDINFHRTMRVDEYLNAFSQDWLKVPDGEALVVRLDPLATKGAEAGRPLIYQIAIKTRRPTPKEMATPVALSLVADVSGSMSGEKINDMQQALINAIGELRDNDLISLLTFNDTATVIAPNVVINAVTRRYLIEHVRQIQAGGGTNIESGLVAGYGQLAAFPSGVNKRLVLLTDGQSTVDALSPEQIADKAAVQYQAGARISTVGIGFDVNEDMLRRIADYGKGHYYFAENSRELTRILREDLQTTVIPVAREVTLVLELAQGYVFENLYGPGAGEAKGKAAITVPVGELNVNDWRILIAEIVQGAGEASPRNPIHLSGSYVNMADGQKHSLRDLSRGTVTEAQGSLKNINAFVLRNSVLYGNALALIEAGKLHQQRKYAEAIVILDAQINNNKILETLDHSEMIKREQENLATVRSLLIKKSGVQSEGGAGIADLNAGAPTGSGGALKSLIIAGLKISEKALPGLWSTVARILIVVLE